MEDGVIQGVSGLNIGSLGDIVIGVLILIIGFKSQLSALLFNGNGRSKNDKTKTVVGHNPNFMTLEKQLDTLRSGQEEVRGELREIAADMNKLVTIVDERLRRVN